MKDKCQVVYIAHKAMEYANKYSVSEKVRSWHDINE